MKKKKIMSKEKEIIEIKERKKGRQTDRKK